MDPVAPEWTEAGWREVERMLQGRVLRRSPGQGWVTTSRSAHAMITSISVFREVDVDVVVRRRVEPDRYLGDHDGLALRVDHEAWVVGVRPHDAAAFRTRVVMHVPRAVSRSPRRP
jgi:hypothetical protein